MKSEKHILPNSSFFSGTIEWYGWFVKKEQHPYVLGCAAWLFKDKDELPLQHRTDGPARIFYNNAGEIVGELYFICGIKVSKEDFYTPGFIDAFILEHS